MNYLRQQCLPTDPVERGEHKHQCPECGTAWKHRADRLTRGSGITEREHSVAHQCPQCETSQYDIFRTDEEFVNELFDKFFGDRHN